MNKRFRLGLCAALAVTPLFAGTAVLSRVEQAGGGHSKLSLQQIDDKRYLYAHRASDRSLTIFDVTNEEKPSIVRTLTHEHLASVGEVRLLPNRKALLSTNDPAPGSSYSLALWSLSDEAHPQQVAAVTSHLVENRRGLLYFFDEKGLTIIRLHESPEKLDAQRWAETLAP
jgi:hypothetical protein